MADTEDWPEPLCFWCFGIFENNQSKMKITLEVIARSGGLQPVIDCIECDHIEFDKEQDSVTYWCSNPEAEELRGVILYRDMGTEMDILNSPAQCPRREE